MSKLFETLERLAATIESRKGGDPAASYTARLLADPKLDPVARVKTAYERSLARPPSAQEVDQALTFVAKMQKEWKGDELKAWQSYCKSLLASSEFIYVN